MARICRLQSLVVSGKICDIVSAMKANGNTKLTAKQRLFIEAYIGEANGNATQAARIAGYTGTDNTVAQRGFELVRNSKIQPFISQRVTEAAMSATEVLHGLSLIAKDVNERAGDRIRAYELIGKHHRLFDRAGEITNHLADAKAAIVSFLAENPKADPKELAPIYAATFSTPEKTIDASDLIN
jgi:phage terminase small subunit